MIDTRIGVMCDLFTAWHIYRQTTNDRHVPPNVLAQVISESPREVKKYQRMRA